MTVRIAALNFYPVKSCKGSALTSAQLTATGFEFDRHWMLVNSAGKFLTQRELPRMALIDVALAAPSIQLSAPDMPSIVVQQRDGGREYPVTVWRDTLPAIDEGDEASGWLSKFLRAEVRLVRFHGRERRVSNRDWTGDVEALNQFSDGYPILAIGEASLADLNSRLPAGAGPLPMNRFRPNIVLSGLDAYDEDRVRDMQVGNIRLRVVKPCTRCKITTTDQSTGEALGDEPIRTLKSYRWDSVLRGVTFGQNVIVINGVGSALEIGQELQITWQ